MRKPGPICSAMPSVCAVARVDAVSGCMASGNGSRDGSGYYLDVFFFRAVQAIPAVLTMQWTRETFAHSCTSKFR
ncbi:MAG: hypothetical protein EHM79_11710 [Geobacter sp.]|nr:MAG: hypothetical protein EHM79_11710 [Geobacter sp.]